MPTAFSGNPIAHSNRAGNPRIVAQQTTQNMRYEARLAPLDGFANVGA